MGRKRIELAPEQEAEISTRIARGETSEAIHAALKGAISKSTVDRRVRELRGKAPDSQIANGETPETVEAVPDNPPETTNLEQVEAWIAILNRGCKAAELRGDLRAVASIAAKVATLMALRHRMAPLPQLDPNDRPDFKALAKQGRALLLQRVHAVFDSPE